MIVMFIWNEALTQWNGLTVLSIQQCNVVCYTEDGCLSIYNMWDKGKGPESQSHTSGMLIEENGDVITYNCNDIGFETNFDKLVFSIEKL